MHINFKKLTLHNFMSFGHSLIEFNNSGFIRVTGQNENPQDMAVSNGSGKSSLWESIIWCLTGETIRGTKQVTNIFGEDGTYVELEFDIDNKQYNITRSKDHKEYKTMLRILIDGKDCSGKGIRDSEKLLQQYLPDITASFLGSVIILGQGLPQKFTNNTPAGRKEVLEKLSKSDFMIEDLKNRISSRKSDVSKNIRQFEDSILTSTSRKTTLLSMKQQTMNKLEELDKNSFELELSSCKEEYDNLVLKQENINSGIHQYQFDIQILNDVIFNEQSLLNEQLRVVNDEMGELINEVSSRLMSVKTQMQFVSDEIQRHKNIKDVCPTCGQIIPGVVKPDTTRLEEQFEQLKTQSLSDSTLLQQLNAEKTQKISQLNNEFKVRVTEKQNQRIDLTNKLSDAQNESKRITTQLQTLNSRVTQISLQIAQIDSTRSIFENSLREIDKELEELEHTLLYNNTEKDLQQSRLDILTKFDTAVKRDFRGYLLTSVIEYIEKRAKLYCKQIFDTEKICFCLDGNNIHISYLDKDYENLSGGEKQKIDLIVQFSIRDMLSNHLGFTSNILVLDEVFDGLDTIGCNKVIDVISSFTDVMNVFVVTHRKDLSIPSDYDLVVVKSQNGISEIR